MEGEDALVEEKGEAVGGAGAVVGGVLEEAGLRGAVDGVVDEVVGLDAGAGEGGGVGAFEADGGGIDDKVEMVALGVEFGRVEGEDAEAITWAFETIRGEVGGEALGEGGELVEGAVDEDESFAAFEGALGGNGLSGTAAGADDHDAEVLHIDEEFLVDGADEAGAVGVEAEGVGAVEEDGVDRSEGPGIGVDVGAGGEGFELVGDGDVGADEVEFAEALEGLVDLPGFHFEADVAEACLVVVEGGLVELWGEGVGDGVAEDGEAGGLLRAGVEVGAGGEIPEGVEVLHAFLRVVMVCSMRRMDSSRPRMARMASRSGPPVLPLRATRRGNMSWPGLAPCAVAVAAMASLGEDQSGRVRKLVERAARRVGALSLSASFSRAAGSNSTPSPR